MESARINTVVPTSLKRAFTSHCRRRGLRQNRLLAAIILTYLQQDPYEKFRTIITYHDWHTERAIRAGWKRAECAKADRADCPRF
ncbi:MAG: hypothetical protein WD294_15210 [Phycisphaeraceae bacterium]